jgi:hypothetical protein
VPRRLAVFPWDWIRSRDQFIEAGQEYCMRMTVRERPNDSDRRLSAGRSFQTDAAAWLKARLAFCVLTAGTLSSYCANYGRFLIGAY